MNSEVASSIIGTRISAADAGTKFSAIGRDGSAVDGDIIALTASASANACSSFASRGFDFAAIDGDVFARSIPASTDACSIFAATCRNVAAMNDERTHMTVFTTNARPIFLCVVRYEFTHPVFK